MPVRAGQRFATPASPALSLPPEERDRRVVPVGAVGERILGPDGRAVEGARVTLQASDGRHPQTTEINTQGRFWFSMLPAGLYDVRAYSQSRSSEWRKKVLVEVGRQTTITLRLSPKK